MPAYILRRKDNSKNGVEQMCKISGTMPPEFGNFKFLKISDEQALLLLISVAYKT